MKTAPRSPKPTKRARETTHRNLIKGSKTNFQAGFHCNDQVEESKYSVKVHEVGKHWLMATKLLLKVASRLWGATPSKHPDQLVTPDCLTMTTLLMDIFKRFSLGLMLHVKRVCVCERAVWWCVRGNLGCVVFVLLNDSNESMGLKRWNPSFYDDPWEKK